MPALAGLLWVAVAAQLLIAAISFRLLMVMEELFTAAVVEGRVFPFTGELGDQSFWPLFIFLVSALGTAVTLWFTLTIRGLLRHWRMPWTAVAVIAALVVLLIDWPIASLVTPVRDDEISQELYAGWYVPCIYVGAAAHATSLIAGSLFSRLHFARVAPRPGGPQ